MAHSYDRSFEEMLEFATVSQLTAILNCAKKFLEPESMIEAAAPTPKKMKKQAIIFFADADNIEYNIVENFYNYMARNYSVKFDFTAVVETVDEDFVSRSCKLQKDKFMKCFTEACRRVKAMDIHYTRSLINLGRMLMKLKSIDGNGWANTAALITGYTADYIRKIHNCAVSLYPYLDKLVCCAIPFAHLAFRAPCLDEFLKVNPDLEKWWRSPVDKSSPPLAIVPADAPLQHKAKRAKTSVDC